MGTFPWGGKGEDVIKAINMSGWGSRTVGGTGEGSEGPMVNRPGCTAHGRGCKRDPEEERRASARDWAKCPQHLRCYTLLLLST